jgi:hypothetical protein
MNGPNMGARRRTREIESAGTGPAKSCGDAVLDLPPR